MIIKALRSNNIISVGLPILFPAVIWCAVALKRTEVPTLPVEPVFQTFWAWFLNTTALSVVAGLLLLSIGAFLWNRFITNQALLSHPSNMPALFYAILLSYRPVQVGFYPALAASFFLILALRRVAESYSKEKALSEAFDSGLLTGIAALIYLPASVFLLFLWIAFATLSTVVWRELVVSLVGFLLPLLFIVAYFAIFTSDLGLFLHKIPLSLSYHGFSFVFSWQHILLYSVLVLTTLVSLIFFAATVANNVVKKQKIWWLMLWFAFFAIGAGLLAPQKDSRSFSLLAIPCSFIFSNFFLSSKSKWIPDVLFILLTLSIGINIVFR